MDHSSALNMSVRFDWQWTCALLALHAETEFYWADQFQFNMCSCSREAKIYPGCFIGMFHGGF